MLEPVRGDEILGKSATDSTSNCGFGRAAALSIAKQNNNPKVSQRMIATAIKHMRQQLPCPGEDETRPDKPLGVSKIYRKIPGLSRCGPLSRQPVLKARPGPDRKKAGSFD